MGSKCSLMSRDSVDVSRSSGGSWMLNFGFCNIDFFPAGAEKAMSYVAL